MIKQIQAFFEANTFLNKSIELLISLVILYSVSRFIIKFINKVIFINSKSRNQKQLKTITGVLNSTIKFIAYFFMLVMILAFIGVDVSSIIAVAGIGSIALGFGSQALVKDVISGIFILLEDQYQVDDIVTLDGFTGRVEAINLRITTLRNTINNEVYIVPNGQIAIVTNKTKDFQKVNFTFKLSFSKDIDKLKSLAESVLAGFGHDDRIISAISCQVYYDDEMPVLKLNISCSVVNGSTISVRRDISSVMVDMFKENGFEQIMPVSVINN